MTERLDSWLYDIVPAQDPVYPFYFLNALAGLLIVGYAVMEWRSRRSQGAAPRGSAATSPTVRGTLSRPSVPARLP